MKHKREMSEVEIHAAYRLGEVLSFDNDDFGEDLPIYIEEVKLRFERSDDQ